MRPALAMLAAAAILGTTSVVRAEDTAAACVADAEAGQSLRDDGKLMDGRARFIRCSSEGCPAVVRRECVQWLTDVDQRLPSIVLATRDGSAKDVVGASLVLDGKPLGASVIGRELPVDPGPHRLEATLKGYVRVLDSVVVREREKGRSIVLVLRSERPAVVLVPTRRTIPVVSWVLGGVAAAGGAGFGVFWARSLDEVSDLRASCAPYCTSDRIDDARLPANVARISAAIGITAAVAAVALYFLTPPGPLRPPRSTTAGTF